jgi:AraC-like DNA-binding protein
MRGLAQGAVGGDAIADAVGSSKRTLNRRLAERGTSIRELVAQKLMRDTDVTIADIAATICYSDVAAFSRAFSARMDMSPAAWRQQATPQGRKALKRKEPNAGRIG